jgi:hypothetical protein
VYNDGDEKKQGKKPKKNLSGKTMVFPVFPVLQDQNSLEFEMRRDLTIG